MSWRALSSITQDRFNTSREEATLLTRIRVRMISSWSGGFSQNGFDRGSSGCTFGASTTVPSATTPAPSGSFPPASIYRHCHLWQSELHSATRSMSRCPKKPAGNHQCRRLQGSPGISTKSKFPPKQAGRLPSPCVTSSVAVGLLFHGHATVAIDTQTNFRIAPVAPGAPCPVRTRTKDRHALVAVGLHRSLGCVRVETALKCHFGRHCPLGRTRNRPSTYRFTIRGCSRDRNWCLAGEGYGRPRRGGIASGTGLRDVGIAASLCELGAADQPESDQRQHSQALKGVKHVCPNDRDVSVPDTPRWHVDAHLSAIHGWSRSVDGVEVTIAPPSECPYDPIARGRIIGSRTTQAGSNRRRGRCGLLAADGPG